MLAQITVSVMVSDFLQSNEGPVLSAATLAGSTRAGATAATDDAGAGVAATEAADEGAGALEVVAGVGTAAGGRIAGVDTAGAGAGDAGEPVATVNGNSRARERRSLPVSHQLAGGDLVDLRRRRQANVIAQHEQRRPYDGQDRADRDGKARTADALLQRVATDVTDSKHAGQHGQQTHPRDDRKYAQVAGDGGDRRAWRLRFHRLGSCLIFDDRLRPCRRKSRGVDGWRWQWRRLKSHRHVEFRRGIVDYRFGERRRLNLVQCRGHHRVLPYLPLARVAQAVTLAIGDESPECGVRHGAERGTLTFDVHERVTVGNDFGDGADRLEPGGHFGGKGFVELAAHQHRHRRKYLCREGRLVQAHGPGDGRPIDIRLAGFRASEHHTK